MHGPSEETGPLHALDTSIYVHFPWCLRRCPYCDFATRQIELEDIPHRDYADALLREVDHRAPALAGRRLSSIFVGGGTPSLWSGAELSRVLNGVRTAFDRTAPEMEVTVECNPSSIDRPRAAALREAGVDRVSIGVQSLSDAHLQFLGRLHDGRGAIDALEGAISEIPRVSADLIFGMPGQSPQSLTGDIQTLLELGIRHVSAYALTIEPGTPFGELHRAGRLEIATEEAYADLFIRAATVFEEAGLDHYEVSNYAEPGQESVHNLHYWRGLPYVGLGAGAVGCLEGARGHARRYRNGKAASRYMESAGTARSETFEEKLGPQDLVREAFMLGLRTREGVHMEATGHRLGVDPREGRERAISRRLAQGDLEVDGPWLRVPRSRWLHLDGIVADLF